MYFITFLYNLVNLILKKLERAGSKEIIKEKIFKGKTIKKISLTGSSYPYLLTVPLNRTS